MPKAYSYLRFSTPEQMKGDSFRRQTTLAQEHAARNHLDLDDKLTFHDLGVSGFREKNSETGRLAEFLEAVRTGLVPRGSYLLVESLDRISRQAARKAMKVLESICDEGITGVTLNDGRAYTEDILNNDPMALIMSLLVFIRANEESANKSIRIKAVWSGKRAKATQKPLTANGPFWLRLDKTTGQWHVIPECADIVRRIFREYLSGTGPNAIMSSLNREAVPVFLRDTQRRSRKMPLCWAAVTTWRPSRMRTRGHGWTHSSRKCSPSRPSGMRRDQPAWQHLGLGPVPGRWRTPTGGPHG